VQRQSLPDLAEGVGAFYHLVTAEVLSSGGMGRMLKELGFDQV
jgi:hypothetical protein